MATSTDIADPPRATVRIPTASGEEIEAWVYQAEGPGPRPAVVMAHGLAAIKAGGLAPYAERFAREGFTTVAFDYRQWGGSSGEPREVASVPRQREDYRTVIDWAMAEPEIDQTQVFIWGTSFSGLQVVEIAATDARLRGAIAQTPLVDGLAGAKMAPATHAFHLLLAGLLDRLGALFGRTPRYIPAGVGSGEFGAVANAAALAGQDIIRPKDGAEWHNRIAARSLLGVAAHRPARRAADIRCPILLVVAEHDMIAPVGPALRIAEHAPRAELLRSRGDHYDVYQGGEDFDNVVTGEVEFLHRHSRP
jgi:pimeloyl-ACP methyl ester carboxylesterase